MGETMTKLICHLKKHMYAFKINVQAVCETYDGTDELWIVEKLLGETLLFDQWISGISENPDACSIMPWKDLFSLTKWEWFYIEIYTALLHYILVKQKHTSDPTLISLLCKCRREWKAVHTLISCFRKLPAREFDKFSLFIDPPHLAMDSLWPLLKWSNIESSKLPEAPAVVYNLEILRRMVLGIARIFDLPWNSQISIKVTLRQCTDGADLCFTIPGHIVTPERWNMFYRGLVHINDEQGNYERLREFGGSIEPLVWDEGYGQGVIVRLPWAKPS